MTTTAISQETLKNTQAIQETSNRFNKISLPQNFGDSLKASDSKLATALKVTKIVPAILWTLNKLMGAVEKAFNVAIVAPANAIHRAIFGSRTVEAMPVKKAEDDASETAPVAAASVVEELVITAEHTRQEVAGNKDGAAVAAPLSGNWAVAAGAAAAVAVVSLGVYSMGTPEIVTNTYNSLSTTVSSTYNAMFAQAPTAPVTPPVNKTV